MYGFVFKCAFVAFLTCPMFVKNTNVSNKVIVMNELLANPGWRGLGELEIVVMPTDSSRSENDYYKVDHLLQTNRDAPIVNVDNLDSKIVEANQFSTCHFAVVYTKLFNYQLSIEGRRLNGLLRETIEMIDAVFLRVQHAFLFFRRMSPQTHELNGKLSGILDDFFNNDFSVVPREDIREILTDITNRIFWFFYTFCWTNLEQVTASPDFVTPTDELVFSHRQLVEDFIGEDYPSFGFTYDSASSSTRVK